MDTETLQKEYTTYYKLNPENETHNKLFFKHIRSNKVDIYILTKLQKYHKWLVSLITRINHKRNIFLGIVGQLINSNEISIESLEKNPTLLHEHYEITYRVLDNIALKNKWWLHGSLLRHEVILRHVIESICKQRGHIYIHWIDIQHEINGSRDDEIYRDINVVYLHELLNDKEFRNKYKIQIKQNGKITLKKYSQAEESMKQNIFAMNQDKYNMDKLTDSDFTEFYDKGCHPLSTEQIKSINTIYKHRICAVTGQGGSGKTSYVVKYLCKHILRDERSEQILFLAPTHAAKKRGKDELTQDDETLSQNMEFKTIHSAIAVGKENMSFIESTLRKGNRFIIIDEMSMVDLETFSEFLAICSFFHSKIDFHIVLLGDTNQLDPVSIGCPFRDILEHNMIKHCKLTRNFRSDGDLSKFCKEVYSTNSWSFNKQMYDAFPNKYTSDIYYHFTQQDTFQSTIYKLLLEFRERGYKPFSLQDPDEPSEEELFQVLSYKNSDCIYISKMIRNIFTQNQSNEKFTKDDPVIVKINDKERKIFNGDEGIILCKVESENSYKIRMTTGERIGKEYSYEEDELKPAFTRTVHSSQGLQFPTVIYTMTGQGYNINKNINYTAYSRAKQKLHLVGDIQCFNSEKARQPSERRNTFIHLKYSKL